jgi:hypothetical protein
VTETSCCGEYEWASEAGQYFVLREARDGGYEEIGRGLYANARRVWNELISAHRHRRRAS